jgi:NAD(P)-dependent dehydrogenase (short-subunit alcohol dehydrogenase family)
MEATQTYENMKGKVALITGAGKGIGRSTALAFAYQKVKVILADWDEDAARGTGELVEEMGGEYLVLKVDVSKPDDVERMVQQTIEEFGQLDYACNNAGIGGESNNTSDYSVEGWKKVMSVNLDGVFYSMKYELPHILKQKGAIVNMASILGKVGFASAPAYSAAKHGVIGLTESAALEFSGQGVRINAICPAFIKTPMLETAGIVEGEEIYDQLKSMHPIGRLGSPEEIANAVVWLCSEAASFVTGTSLMVDGGYTAH